MSYQDRVKQENRDLEVKMDALASFINGDQRFISLETMEQVRMYSQLSAMRQYNRILLDRIENFK